MKRGRPCVTFAVILFLLAVAGSSSTTPYARLDPLLRDALEDALQKSGASVSPQSLLQGPMHGDVSWDPDVNEQAFRVLVKLLEPFHGASLGDLPVIASTGTIVSVSATIPELLSLLADDRIVYVEASRSVAPHVDVSVPLIYSAAAGGGSSRVTGDGVIVGAVDTGIDYTHLDFRFDGTGDGVEESSRILAILDQTYGFFGVEYTREDIETDLANGHGPNAGIVRQKDTDGHGTHVMGIAAGDGSSSTSGFVGMAPDAWIVMVKSTYYTADILAGVRYIFDLADREGLPAVVNLSLGGHDGPHDGTSLFEQGITELTQVPGRIVIVSAGNEGDLPIHVSGTLQGTASSFTINTTGLETQLVLWYPGSSRFSVEVSPPSGPSVVTPWRENSGLVLTPFGTVRVDNASSGANPSNGDHEVSIRLTGLLASTEWDVTITDTSGSGGTFHGWMIRGTASIMGGDSRYTIDEPGNATGAITVGSFNSKAVWSSLSGEQNYLAQYPIGVLSTFSSQGPTRDGRTKPEIAAPGAWIGSALSRDAPWQSHWVTSDGVHTMLLGTSMAAPHVAGAVALMLSVNPTLTVHQVRALLTQTAMRDLYTGMVPNNRWGWGKVDVSAALARVQQPPIPPPPPSDPDAPRAWLVSNPVSSLAAFSLDIPLGARWAKLRVYSAAGQLVFETSIHPSSEQMEWSLVSSSGATLPSGLYLYVLVTDVGVSNVGRLVIAR